MKKLAIMLFAGLIASALMLAQGATTYAHGPHHGGGYHYQGGNLPPAPQLTPEQIEKAKEIFGNASGKIEGLVKSLTAKQSELDAELAKTSPSSDKIVDLSREIGEIRGKLMNERNAVRAQMVKEGIPAPVPGQFPCPASGFNGAPCGSPCPANVPCNAGNAPCPAGAPCAPANMPCGGYMHGPRQGCW